MQGRLLNPAFVFYPTNVLARHSKEATNIPLEDAAGGGLF
jgi:hypothetical protein